MTLYLGLDIGTTHITALALDAATGKIAASHSVANVSETTSRADKARGHSEWDAAQMVTLAWDAIRQTTELLPNPSAVSGIGVSGQMHGVCLLSGQLEPLSPFIGWQDQRGEERMPGSQISYLERARELAADLPGVRLATGFMGLTLFWMKEEGHTFPDCARACFISDYAVSWLTGEPPCVDPSNADSSGFFDTARRRWNEALIARLGLPLDILPPVRAAPASAGRLRPRLARESGMRTGIPVCVSIGDNQASFAGSVADYAGSISLNIGTGGQISVYVPSYIGDDVLETRSYMDGGYLVVSAGLCGERSYALLKDFFRAVGRVFYNARGDEDLYGRMNELAATVAPGSDGLVCNPLFTGTRRDPTLRASWCGFSPENFSPAHMTRALLEGLVRTFVASYGRMRRIGVAERAKLVGSGNGLRRNPLLAQIAASAFGMPMYIPRHEEGAAYGAALLAAVSDGRFPHLEAASRLICYQPAIRA